MPFIRVQNIKRDENGKIVSGSASIIDVEYVKDRKHHAKQIVREKLGKVISLESKRRGVFMSPERGLVIYDADKDEFERVLTGSEEIENLEVFLEPEDHPIFGEAYLVFSFMESSGILRIIRNLFTDDSEYERAVLHLTYGIARNGSNETCDIFMDNTFAAYLAPDVPVNSVRSDTAYFTAMGNEGIKKEFFKRFVTLMRSKYPKFGRCCYIDTTPLPNDSVDNPFNALCSHGVEATSVQMRLAVIQDILTGYPVWFEIIPSNVLDVTTIMDEMDDLKATLGITILDLVLDAGYACENLICKFNADEAPYDDPDDVRTIVVRMPNKRGFCYMELFNECRKMFDNGKYAFVRNKHTYFGIKREIELFGHKEFAYVYLDRENAAMGFRNWMGKHEEEYGSMTDKKKTYRLFEDGFFILISNKDSDPKSILDDYFGRQWIENLFKTAKTYLKLLPIAKWNNNTVRGKILSDMIDTIMYLSMRNLIIKNTNFSMSDALSHPKSLIGYRVGDDISIKTPKKQVKDIYASLDIPIPASINLPKFTSNRLLLRIR